MHYRPMTDKQRRRKGKILCAQTKRRGKLAQVPEAVNGYRKEGGYFNF